MFCQHCGNPLPDGAMFCDKCGTKRMRKEEDSQHTVTIPGEAPQNYGKKDNSPERTGFSGVYADPRILAFKEKKKKSKGGCLLSLAVIVPASVAVVGMIGFAVGENNLETVLFLLEISLIPSAILAVIAWMQKAAARREKSMWEGVVVKKSKKQERDYHADKHDSGNSPHYYTLYTIHVRTDDGKNKKFFRSDDPGFYGYYKVGDRVRYHPVLEYYEKYDKSHDNCIFCACCGTRNPIEYDACKKCGMPLFK